MVSVLRNADGQILMQHRTDDAPGWPGKWTRPEAGLEAGEEPLRSAHRELHEEYGLTVDNATS